MILGPKIGQNVFVVDLEDGTQRAIPNPKDRAQYAAVVDEANSMVYFGREIWCGRNSNIWRLPLDLTGDPEKVVDLPDGISAGWAPSLTANAITGHVDLYYERYECATGRGDVFVAPSVDARLSS